jgi:hypothetical protein
LCNLLIDGDDVVVEQEITETPANTEGKVSVIHLNPQGGDIGNVNDGASDQEKKKAIQNSMPSLFNMSGHVESIQFILNFFRTLFIILVHINYYGAPAPPPMVIVSNPTPSVNKTKSVKIIRSMSQGGTNNEDESPKRSSSANITKLTRDVDRKFDDSQLEGFVMLFPQYDFF